MATPEQPTREMGLGQRCCGCPADGGRVCANDLIKCTEDSRTDWKTLGNIITANLLGEVLCASYADYKYGKRSRNFKPIIDWKFSYEENDVLVFTKKCVSDSSALCFMGRSMIELPVCIVAAFVQDLHNYPSWNTFMTESRLVKLLSESDNHRSSIGYFCHEMKKLYVRRKRDMALFIHSSYSVDTFTHAVISVNHPCCPPVKSITRAKFYLGSGLTVEPYEGQKSKSLVSYVCNGDMRGSIPPIIMKLFLQRQPMAVHYLKQSVMEYTQKQMPIHRSRFPLKTHGTKTAEQRTNYPLTDSTKDDNSSIQSLDLGRNILQSFIFVSTLTNQYEEPVGISEFVGHRSMSSKQRQWSQRRHRCCGRTVEDYTSENESLVFSSDLCEECAVFGDHLKDFSFGKTRHTYT